MENSLSRTERLAALRAQVTSLEGGARRAVRASPFKGGGFPQTLRTRVLHDLYATTPADAVALNAFGLGLALRAAGGRTIVWVLHDLMGQEAGRPDGQGLHEMGIAPSDLVLVSARDVTALLAAGEEALRTPAVGAVLLSAWGEAKAIGLTASRRLALAAETGGGPVFFARAAAEPAPSAAETRWAIRAAASVPLDGEAPGRPAFSATLLRHRGGGAPKTWIMEWDRERRSFIAPTLSGGLVPLAAQRPAEAPGLDDRRVA